jgi:hypothetical protein
MTGWELGTDHHCTDTQDSMSQPSACVHLQAIRAGGTMLKVSNAVINWLRSLISAYLQVAQQGGKSEYCNSLVRAVRWHKPSSLIPCPSLPP